MEQQKSSNSSSYGVGVSLDKRPGRKVYKTRVHHKGQVIDLGRFDDPHTARLAYDQAVRLLGKNTKTNYTAGEYELDNPVVARKIQAFLTQLEQHQGSKQQGTKPRKRRQPQPPRKLLQRQGSAATESTSSSSSSSSSSSGDAEEAADDAGAAGAADERQCGQTGYPASSKPDNTVCTLLQPPPPPQQQQQQQLLQWQTGDWTPLQPPLQLQNHYNHQQQQQCRQQQQQLAWLAGTAPPHWPTAPAPPKTLGGSTAYDLTGSTARAEAGSAAHAVEQLAPQQAQAMQQAPQDLAAGCAQLQGYTPRLGFTTDAEEEAFQKLLELIPYDSRQQVLSEMDMELRMQQQQQQQQRSADLLQLQQQPTPGQQQQHQQQQPQPAAYTGVNHLLLRWLSNSAQNNNQPAVAAITAAAHACPQAPTAALASVLAGQGNLQQQQQQQQQHLRLPRLLGSAGAAAAAACAGAAPGVTITRAGSCSSEAAAGVSVDAAQVGGVAYEAAATANMAGTWQSTAVLHGPVHAAPGAMTAYSQSTGFSVGAHAALCSVAAGYGSSAIAAAHYFPNPFADALQEGVAAARAAHPATVPASSPPLGSCQQQQQQQWQRQAVRKRSWSEDGTEASAGTRSRSMSHTSSRDVPESVLQELQGEQPQQQRRRLEDVVALAAALDSQTLQDAEQHMCESDSGLGQLLREILDEDCPIGCEA